MTYKLSGKVIVITGAAGGIGQSLVQECCRKGAKVVATDLSVEALANTELEARKFGYDIHCKALDVTDPAASQALCASVVKDFGTLDIWVNNAGIARIDGFESTEPATFQAIMDVNFNGVVHGCRAALGHMRDAGKGMIVNVASVSGHIAAPYMTAYTASKHAVVGFTRSLQTELDLEDLPIRLMLVSPGFVDTQIIQKGEAMGFPEWLNWSLAKPHTVAKAIVSAMERREREIAPTLNGKVMLAMYRVAPRATRNSSRLLLTQSFKDLVLGRYQRR